ncbi:MAG TPA: NapC/NirT family cytochrome c, partial [Polyangiaceae bacterium]
MQARNRDAPTKSAETTATQRPRRAWRWALVGAMAVSAVGVGSAGVALQRYSETDAFCGLACHRAMAPQHIGHRDGTHAHARCVDCHIGQGALAHVVAKLRGADQLWGMVTNDFTRPVRMQHRGDEPMRPRCERCHDLAKLPEVHRIQALRFGYDVANRAQSVSVTLRIGNARGNDDGRRGIGWHMQKPDQVSYVAAD